MVKFIAVCAGALVLMSQVGGQVSPPANPPDATLLKLAEDFWTWRAQHAPFTGDDVNRMERPGGVRDWSATAIAKRRADLGEFEARWK
ncbi:MAG: hypothetical protein ABIR29_01025, partial [Chthoniobacterales bacterium]